MSEQRLIVVCGLARCGTSLMMKMLHRGGIEPLCDPGSLHYGYELNDTLSLPDETAWLNNTEGKAVKILDPHRLRLPDDRPYSFILLTRNFKEQAKSHVKFLRAAGVNAPKNCWPALEKSLKRDLPVVERLLLSYSRSRLVKLPFETILNDPLGAATTIDDFLERPDFDLLKAAQCVLKRGPKCLPYMLELGAAWG